MTVPAGVIHALQALGSRRSARSVLAASACGRVSPPAGRTMAGQVGTGVVSVCAGGGDGEGIP